MNEKFEKAGGSAEARRKPSARLGVRIKTLFGGARRFFFHAIFPWHKGWTVGPTLAAAQAALDEAGIREPSKPVFTQTETGAPRYDPQATAAQLRAYVRYIVARLFDPLHDRFVIHLRVPLWVWLLPLIAFGLSILAIRFDVITSWIPDYGREAALAFSGLLALGLWARMLRSDQIDNKDAAEAGLNARSELLFQISDSLWGRGLQEIGAGKPGDFEKGLARLYYTTRAYSMGRANFRAAIETYVAVRDQAWRAGARALGLLVLALTAFWGAFPQTAAEALAQGLAFVCWADLSLEHFWLIPAHIRRR